MKQRREMTRRELHAEVRCLKNLLSLEVEYWQDIARKAEERRMLEHAQLRATNDHLCKLLADIDMLRPRVMVVEAQEASRG